ncbi:MAG: hypothetical protein ACKOCT_20720 [Alphaproteobacteria bacterium]
MQVVASIGSRRQVRLGTAAWTAVVLLVHAFPGAATAACAKAVVTITTSYVAPGGGDKVSGVTTALDYPQSKVTIPGVGGGSDVLSRVTNLSGVSGGLFSVGDNDSILNVGLVSLSTAIPPGQFARATFDCIAGQADPTSGDFGCVADVSSFFGNTIAGTCQVSVTLEQPTPTPTPAATPTPTRTPTPTPSPTPTPAIPPTPTPVPGDEIFSDGFESGDLSAWATESTKGGKMSVAASAKRTGSFGLLFDVAGLPPPANKAKLWVKDTTPFAESRYLARFALDLNTLAVPTSPRILRLFAGRTAGDPAKRPFELRLRFEGGTWKIYGVLRSDAGVGTQTAPVVLPKPGWSLVEVDWRRATSPGASDGSLTLQVTSSNCSPAACVVSATGVDNDANPIDGVQLGFLGGLGLGSSGTVFVDDFESRRQGAFP